MLTLVSMAGVATWLLLLSTAGALSLRNNLLEAPKVAVRPSTIPDAGDGVFVLSDVAAGETITWLENVYSVEEVTGINTYQSDYFAWHQEFGGYELCAKSRRDPARFGVGHIVNDAARLDPVEWSASGMANGQSSVEAYVYVSERDANVVIEEDRVVARKDLAAGAELFRHYGAHYWLRPAEYALHYLMDFARCDLRLVADGAPDVMSHSRRLFDECEARLATLSSEYAALKEELELTVAFDRRHPYVDYDGYEVWLWAHLVPAELRRQLAERLGVYEAPFCPDDDVRRRLRSLHDLDPVDIGTLLRRHHDEAHDAKCQAGLAAAGRSVLAFGRDSDFPW